MYLTRIISIMILSIKLAAMERAERGQAASEVLMSGEAVVRPLQK